MATRRHRGRASRRARAWGTLLTALWAAPGTAAAQLAEQAEPGPAAPVVEPPAKSEGGSSSARPYRVVQVVGAALFGVSYIGSLVSGLVFHDESKGLTEKRHAGYLAYPIAGPFLALGVYEGGAQLFVPIGITQGIGALGFVVGAIGAATIESEPQAAGLHVTPMAGPDGGSLQMTWRF